MIEYDSSCLYGWPQLQLIQLVVLLVSEMAVYAATASFHTTPGAYIILF